MKQIIPFKKELLFKTKVSEITSISLEHTLNLKEDDLISGFFYITGDYKMTEGSINREKFQFDLPFDITLDSRYDVNSIIIDIDNFYYEIINNESLQVNIDVYVEGDKIISDKLDMEDDVINDIKDNREIIVEDTLSLEKTEEVISSKNKEVRGDDATTNLFKEEYVPSVDVSRPKQIILEDNKEYSDISNKVDFNLFDNIDNSDTYVTYYVYIVKEGDNLDSILTKYNVSKEEVSCYNELDNIGPGTKLIIPSCNNE